jgi:Tol biopolymer transport system component/pimeloyl-ACP methyl ester carboxylesterase
MKRLATLLGLVFVACVTMLGGPAFAPSGPAAGASAPDGGLIAFVSNRDGNEEIYVMNADGSGLTDVSNSSDDDLSPAWSPNGARIAYLSYTPEPPSVYGDILVVNPDGTGRSRLTDTLSVGCCMAWSPDASKIAYVSHENGDSEIYVMNADGADKIRLTDNAAADLRPLWSPDGTKIAFQSIPPAGQGDIWVVDADGTGLINVTNHPAAESRFLWSADGSRIFFVSEDRSAPEAYAFLNTEIYAVNVDGTGIANLTNDPSQDGAVLRSDAILDDPSLSPDGTRILFWSGREPQGIYAMNADGSGQTHVADGADWAWSPDGLWIASGRVIDSQLSGIYTIAADGSGEKLLATMPTEDVIIGYIAPSPLWSPDGSKVVFDAPNNDHEGECGLGWSGTCNDIYLANADGSGMVNLTNNPARDHGPTWQPVPASAPEDRKVIFIQGIDSESGECGEDFLPRVQWMVDYLATNSWVSDRVPSLDSTEDFFYFSYSDTNAYCLGTNGLQDFQQPQYDDDNTCDGVADAANRLNTLVGALIYQHPHAKFDIVAHSMGGMVAAYWLQQHEDRRSRVNSVVTFDSPLRGIPFGAPLSALPGPCDQSTSQSQRDLTCGDYSQSDNRDVCTSEIVSTIQDIGDSVPFFTIDATQHAGPVEAVPRDRTTLLSSNSRLHCQFDDGHSSSWENGGLGGGDPLNCWVNFSWPTDPDDTPGSPTMLDPVADAKKVFVACAVASSSDPSACIQKLGSPKLPDGTLSEPSLAGGTEIQLANTSTFAVGDRILINPGMPNEEEDLVAGFGSILLASPLQFDHQAGEPVVKLSAPPSMMAGWNQACYLGAEQPIDQALAGIAGDLLGVYRLNSSQTFARWFPGRLDVSTITSVAPYQPLFVLMANAASWAQSPAEPPPTSAGLVQGWNNVCYAGETKSADDATVGMAGSFSILYRLGSDQTWGRFVPARPELSSITELNTYDSVLMLVTHVGGAQWIFNP